ncbi:MAG: arabinofuranan 3-O-arabinosyltransferase, partial [Actinomycetota bacterium]|nr:arabinofuranan 3-O-arabinosyltransferase [Actinomycetota bacterium]
MTARNRAGGGLGLALLAVLAYVPQVLTEPGVVAADTKTYLYLDPSRLLRQAPSMWDPGIGMGTVTHQNIGYLWPMGPWFWLFDRLGAPPWVAQRLWLGSILFVAGLGVRYLMKALGQRGPHVTAATFLYAL